MPDSTHNFLLDNPTTDGVRPAVDTPLAGTTAGGSAAADHDHDALSAAVREFERAWNAAAPPPIRQFVPDGPHRPAVLAELVLVDAERRLSAGLPVHVTDYLGEFP